MSTTLFVRFGLAILFSTLVIARASLAPAEIMVAETLEWLTDSSPHVGEYEIVEANARTVSNWFQIHLKVKRVSSIKGGCPKESTFRVKSHTDEIAGMSAGTRVMFFLMSLEPEGNVRYKVSLDSPPKQGFLDIAYSKDFRLLTKGNEIRELVKKRAALNRNVEIKDPEAIGNVFALGGNGAVRVEVPFESTAYQALYGGSSCYLVVPADADIRKRLLKQVKSKQTWVRSEAARQLSAFPDKEVRAILQELLKDLGTAEQTSTSGDGKVTKQTVYPVRSAARDALNAIAKLDKKGAK